MPRNHASWFSGCDLWSGYGTRWPLSDPRSLGTSTSWHGRSGPRDSCARRALWLPFRWRPRLSMCCCIDAHAKSGSTPEAPHRSPHHTITSGATCASPSTPLLYNPACNHVRHPAAWQGAPLHPAASPGPAHRCELARGSSSSSPSLLLRLAAVITRRRSPVAFVSSMTLLDLLYCTYKCFTVSVHRVDLLINRLDFTW